MPTRRRAAATSRRASSRAHLVRQRLYDRLRAHGHLVSIHNFTEHPWGYSLVLNPGDIPTEAYIGASTEDLLLAKCLHVLGGAR